MASARKKQDERNLKTLREFVALPHNKHCFDCDQRGPTYVNVTIGSFVCTKCSGMLRGLTPPHRVKSISMATYTPEEIEVLRSKGNEYCRRVWLGLHDGPKPVERDEQAIHTFMLDKYERKRYYMEPSVPLRNGYNRQQPEKPQEAVVKGSLPEPPRPLRLNGEHRAATTTTSAAVRSDRLNGFPVKADFVADFDHADIFNAANNNNNGAVTTTAITQPTFAYFDNNPAFNNTTSMPPLSKNGFSAFNNVTSRPVANGGHPAPPSEDRYAALKDLDNALKSQPSTVDWNSGGSSSSLYSTSTATGSLYSATASPQGSLYGSPSQGNFTNLFSNQEPSNNVSNPFSANGFNMWAKSNGNQNGVANPFHSTADTFNGVSNVQPVFPNTINGTAWTPNPFKVANGHSNNPFL